VLCCAALCVYTVSCAIIDSGYWAGTWKKSEGTETMTKESLPLETAGVAKEEAESTRCVGGEGPSSTVVMHPPAVGHKSCRRCDRPRGVEMPAENSSTRLQLHRMREEERTAVDYLRRCVTI